MLRNLMALALTVLALASSASAQEDVSDMLTMALRDNGCGMTDREARAHFDAAGVPWSQVLEAVRDLSDRGSILVAPDGTYIGIDPQSCHPTPIYVPDTSTGPEAADWLNARLAQEDECRLPVETLRSEALAAGVDPERLQTVLRSWSNIGRQNDETGEIRIELAYCAHLQNPEDWDVLAIANVGRSNLQNAIGRAIEAHGCRVPSGDTTVQELKAAIVESLELDLAAEGLSTLATAVLDTLIREAIADENRAFTVEAVTGDLVAAECASSR